MDFSDTRIPLSRSGHQKRNGRLSLSIFPSRYVDIPIYKVEFSEKNRL